MDHETNIHAIKEKIKEFCEERDWDQFHGAKELAVALIIEAAELLEHFRWKSDKEVEELFSDPGRKEKIKEEMADVLYFLVRLAQRYEIDLSEALENKMKINEEKYPVEKSKGSNKKYNEL
ncbi:MAG: nucleotide pyrophosphohydrolase [Candidatus Aenigmarchaeota archaeon]|nr:nucleotide pyrophosphohydrolase [Candidatus Aenigmarchaeota archaeon]